MPPLQLHICMANDTSAAIALHVVYPRILHFAVPQFVRCSLLCNHQSVLTVAEKHFIYCVADPAFGFEDIEL